MTTGNKPLIFRDAREDDIADIVRLLADDTLGSTREALGDDIDPAYRQAFEAIERDPGNHLIVAELDEEVVGCMQLTAIPHLTFKGGTRLQIEGVRVKDGFRSQQVGRRMITWAIDRARDEGCHLVQLTSNRQRTDAMRFYESLDFEPTHIGYKLYLA